jgi:hypothetical protein
MSGYLQVSAALLPREYARLIEFCVGQSVDLDNLK